MPRFFSKGFQDLRAATSCFVFGLCEMERDDVTLNCSLCITALGKVSIELSYVLRRTVKNVRKSGQRWRLV